MKVYTVWGYDQCYPTGPGDLKGLYTNRDAALDLMEEMLNADDAPDYVTMSMETVKMG